MDYRFSRAFNAAQAAWDNATPEEYEDDSDRDCEPDEPEDSDEAADFGGMDDSKY